MVTAAKAASDYHIQNSSVLIISNRFSFGLSLVHPVSVSRNPDYLCPTVLLFQQMSEINRNQDLWCRHLLSCLKKTFIYFLTWIAWSVALTSPSSVPEPQELNQPVVCPIKFHTSKLLPHMQDNPLPSFSLPAFTKQLMSVLPQQYSSCASCLTVPQVAQHSHGNVIACATLVFPACFPSCVHLRRYLWWALFYLLLSLWHLPCSCHLSPLAIHPCPLISIYLWVVIHTPVVYGLKLSPGWATWRQRYFCLT